MSKFPSVFNRKFEHNLTLRSGMLLSYIFSSVTVECKCQIISDGPGFDGSVFKLHVDVSNGKQYSFLFNVITYHEVICCTVEAKALTVIWLLTTYPRLCGLNCTDNMLYQSPEKAFNVECLNNLNLGWCTYSTVEAKALTVIWLLTTYPRHCGLNCTILCSMSSLQESFHCSVFKRTLFLADLVIGKWRPKLWLWYDYKPHIPDTVA